MPTKKVSRPRKVSPTPPALAFAKSTRTPITARQKAIAANTQKRIDDANALKQAARDLAVRRAREANARPPAPAGSRGDGKFYAAFVQMGQGDCTIMATPKGQVIMIDCGTNSKDQEASAAYTQRVMSVLDVAYFLRKKKTIDVLILSHPDKDHYNKLDTVLPAGVTAGMVYHSTDFAHYGTGRDWVRTVLADASRIKNVVLNELNGAGTASIAGVQVPYALPGAELPDTVEKRDASGGIRIVAEPNCTVTILASDVQNDYQRDGDEGWNRGSVVTLVELSKGTTSHKILLCADATRSTEHFLTHTQAARITRVHTVQAGHHGSNRTSSDQAFVTMVNPTNTVVISAGLEGHKKHHLPSWEVIKRYVHGFETSNHAKTPARSTSAWDEHFEPAVLTPADVEYPLYTTGSHGTHYLTIDLT